MPAGNVTQMGLLGGLPTNPVMPPARCPPGHCLLLLRGEVSALGMHRVFQRWQRPNRRACLLLGYAQVVKRL
jgi:hypothetical protein